MDITDTEALVVRSVDYREHDRILTLLTRDLGKIGAIAYGAKKSRQRFGGALQPFQLLRVVVKRRRGRDLLEMSEAEVVEAYNEIPVDSARYACASWALELVREVTAEDESVSWPVEVLTKFLRILDREGASPSLVAAVTVAALTSSGFGPALDRCAACARPAPPGRAAHFEISRGVVCSSCGGSGPMIRGRVRSGLLRARQWEIPTTCTEAELATAVLTLCAFAHEQVGKELRSWSLLGHYLKRLSTEAEVAAD